MKTQDEARFATAAKTAETRPAGGLTDKRGIAAILGFSLRHIDNLLAQGCPHLKFGARRVRFNPQEVLAWCDENFKTRRIGPCNQTKGA